MGLYYFDNELEPTLFLETKRANPTTYMENKVMYIFLKSNIILNPEVVYRDQYNIEYVKVPKEVVSTYYFGGLPLYNAIGQVRTSFLELSIQSLSRNTYQKTLSRSKRDPATTSYKVPLSTKITKVRGGIGMRGENLAVKHPTTPHKDIGTSPNKTMEAFSVKLPTTSQPQIKLRPSDFKKLVENFDEAKDPYNSTTANITDRSLEPNM